VFVCLCVCVRSKKLGVTVKGGGVGEDEEGAEKMGEEGLWLTVSASMLSYTAPPMARKSGSDKDTSWFNNCVTAV
jgi:hypothetical protein